MLQGWPVVQPDILVSTPVAFLNSLFSFEAENHRRPEFLRAVKHVVSICYSLPKIMILFGVLIVYRR